MKKKDYSNHLPIYNNDELTIKFKQPNFPECTNYPNHKIQPRELDAFEKHPFVSSLSQEVVTYDQNLYTDNLLFNTRMKI